MRTFIAVVGISLIIAVVIVWSQFMCGMFGLALFNHVLGTGEIARVNAMSAGTTLSDDQLRQIIVTAKMQFLAWAWVYGTMIATPSMIGFWLMSIIWHWRSRPVPGVSDF